MALISFLKRLLFRDKASASSPTGERTANGPRKWLPVIDSDSCSGCGLCLQVCEHGSLDMVWSFATLTDPHECGSEGHCMDACPEDLIVMDWVRLEGERKQGTWKAPECPDTDDGLGATP